MIRCTILLILFFCCSQPLFSQIYLEGKLLEPANEQIHYLAVEPVLRIKNGERGVELRVQTAKTPRRNAREWLTDAGGGRMHFNNWLAALDYLYRAGWETVSPVEIYLANQYNETWYLLKPR